MNHGSDDHTKVCSVIADRLFLTGAEGASDWEQVKQAKIQCVVNLSGHPDAFPSDLDYLTLEISDDADQDITPVFERACEFIAAAENKAVLVHCVQGCSRAASVVIAFLIKSKLWTLKQSFDHVRASRPIIEPNPGFWKHLERFECATLAQSSSSLPLVEYLGTITRVQYVGEEDFDPELWKDAFAKCMKDSFDKSNGTSFPEMWDFLACYEEKDESQQRAKKGACAESENEEGNNEVLDDGTVNNALWEIEMSSTRKRKYDDALA